MFVENAKNFLEGLIVQRREIDAADLRADSARYRMNADDFVTHCGLLPRVSGIILNITPFLAPQPQLLVHRLVGEAEQDGVFVGFQAVFVPAGDDKDIVWAPII